MADRGKHPPQKAVETDLTAELIKTLDELEAELAEGIKRMFADGLPGIPLERRRDGSAVRFSEAMFWVDYHHVGFLGKEVEQLRIPIAERRRVNRVLEWIHPALCLVETVLHRIYARHG